MLRQLVSETGARRVVWSRLYDAPAIERDSAIKAALRAEVIDAVSVNASLLFEPWTVATGQGGYYRVYTPYWKAVRGRGVETVTPPPGDLAPPSVWPQSDRLGDWAPGRDMQRGAAVVSRHARIGEDAARERLEAFLENAIIRYREDRDRLDLAGTSGLSESLAHGEISPRRIWRAACEEMRRRSGGDAGQAEPFLKELVWREFAYHLLYHTLWVETRSWRENWADFPWRPDSADAERWRRGMIGIEVIDAAMRQLYVTGTMHNRARMLVASFLTKHLLVHWRVGADWFRDFLIDWDPAANAMGWQWSAGSGPDAAPYFRIFNPETRAARFDPEGRYRDRFLAEERRSPSEDALTFFEAAPPAWGLSAEQTYPASMIDLGEGRARALAVYHDHRARHGQTR